jgi:FkbM family methyltransferase
MNLNGLFKPEYIFQPRKLINKFLPQSLNPHSEFVQEVLPWELKIRVRPEEEHGKILATLGIIDLAVTEILFRLTDEGEFALDVGANIGYMTSVLSLKVGKNGKVYAFEAHPEIFDELSFNVQSWLQDYNISNIESNHVAVSDSSGEVELLIPLDFQTNRGLASVQKGGRDIGYQSITVSSISLDDRFINQEIGVLKLDVEGHELNVLKGARRLLQIKKIRDCIFEEHNNYPTDTTSYLEEMGYTIYRVHRHFLGLTLLPPDSLIPKVSWLPTSFLATAEPKRAINRCKSRGWNCLTKRKIKSLTSP